MTDGHIDNSALRPGGAGLDLNDRDDPKTLRSRVLEESRVDAKGRKLTVRTRPPSPGPLYD